MASTIEVDENYPIIAARFDSAIKPLELFEATSRVLAMAEQQGISMVICDCSEFTSSLNVLDLLEHTRKMAAHNPARNIKMALLMPYRVHLTANTRFWETVCSNHSMNIKLFNHQPDALHWLQNLAEDAAPQPVRASLG